MADIIKTYRQDFPGARFVGLRYSDADRVNGGFGPFWQQWDQAQRFDQLRAQLGSAPQGLDGEGEEFLGLMRHKDGEPFQYWIGLWGGPGVAVPEGYGCVDFGRGALGITWLKGTMADVFGQESRCAEALVAAGMQPVPGPDGASWFFERYIDSRFLNSDAEGRIILDIGHFIG